MIEFKIPRQYMEALHLTVFKELRLHCQTIQLSIARQPLDKDKMVLMIEVALIGELDAYFSKRLAIVKTEKATVKLSEAQGTCLYMALMGIRLNEHDAYLFVVRQAFIEKLFPVICGSGPAPRLNQPAHVNDVQLYRDVTNQ